MLNRAHRESKVTMKTVNRQRFAFVVALSALSFACGDTTTPSSRSEELTQELAARSEVFAGTVLDAGGAPISGARVTINGITRLTSGTGRYFLSVRTSRQGYRLDVRRNGYAPATEFLLAGALNLVHELESGFTQEMDPEKDNRVSEPDSGIVVSLPANSLRSNNGAPQGEVKLTIIPHSSQTMPGDLTARNRKGEEVAMVSVGAVTLQAEDSEGNTLGLAPGAEIVVQLPVPESAGKNMPECVLSGSCRAAVWRFDPATALWIEQAEANPDFNDNGTTFVAAGREDQTIDPDDGLGTWNADVEFVDPACTVVEFTSVPLDCFWPPGVPLEPGIEVGFTQALAGGGTKSKTADVLSSAAFVLLYNLRANVDVDLWFTFPAGAPAYCATNMSINSIPTPNPGFPVYTPTGGQTQLDSGAPWGGTGYPTNSGGTPVTFSDVVIGDHPCNSYVQVSSSP